MVITLNILSFIVNLEFENACLHRTSSLSGRNTKKSFQILSFDRLFGIVVSTSDCHPRGPGFDSRLYSTNFSGSIGSGAGSTQPREDNWVAT